MLSGLAVESWRDATLRSSTTDQDKPAENHLCMPQTLIVPELTRVVTGHTSGEAAVHFPTEGVRICKDVYHEDGIQVNCVAAWLHAVRLKPPAMEKFGPPAWLATMRAPVHLGNCGAAAEGLSA